MEAGFEFRSGLFLYSVYVSVTTLLWRLSRENGGRWTVSGSWRGKKVKLLLKFSCSARKTWPQLSGSWSVSVMLSEGLDEFAPVGLYGVAKWAAQSQFSREETLQPSREFLFRSNSSNMQNHCHWSLAYGTASDTVWYSHKRGICHLTGLRLWDCGGSPQPCCTNVCKLGSSGVFSFITKSLSPWGLPCPFDHSCAWWICRADLDHLPNVGDEECCPCLHFYL